MDRNEMIRRRAKLMTDIKKFEREDMDSDAWFSVPSPDEKYIADLEALAKLCLDMARAHRDR